LYSRGICNSCSYRDHLAGTAGVPPASSNVFIHLPIKAETAGNRRLRKRARRPRSQYSSRSQCSRFSLFQ
jgi:hypothetical protein